MAHYLCLFPGREEERGAAELGVAGQLHHADLQEVREAQGPLRRARPPRPAAEHLLVGGLQEPAGESGGNE